MDKHFEVCFIVSKKQFRMEDIDIVKLKVIAVKELRRHISQSSLFSALNLIRIEMSSGVSKVKYHKVCATLHFIALNSFCLLQCSRVSDWYR